jgi:ParB family chromosome partitioning protein
MEHINIGDISVKNQYLRLDDDIDSLMKSIETVGLINPITINENNELLAGGRRYSALKALGKEEVPVIRVSKSDLEQELISIDENLVRKPLKNLDLEKSLNRGRELYEQLNPEAPKVDLEVKELSPMEKKELKEQEEMDTTSFAAVTALKTGLSPSTIKSAIKRDVHSSPEVKKARSSGELNSSQVNELIKLNDEEQDEILPYVQDRPVKDIRKIVKAVKESGVHEAITMTQTMETAPREIVDLLRQTKKINKTLSKLQLEEINYQGKEREQLDKELSMLLTHLTLMDLEASESMGVSHVSNTSEETTASFQ